MSNQYRAEGVMLPEPALNWPTGAWLRNGSRVLPGSYYTADQMREYARATMATPQAPGADTPGGRGEVACWRSHWPGGGLGAWRDGDIDPAHRADCEKHGLIIELAYTHPAESSGGDAVDAAIVKAYREALAECQYTAGEAISIGVNYIRDRVAAIASGAECGDHIVDANKMGRDGG